MSTIIIGSYPNIVPVITLFEIDKLKGTTCQAYVQGL